MTYNEENVTTYATLQDLAYEAVYPFLGGFHEEYDVDAIADDISDRDENTGEFYVAIHDLDSINAIVEKHHLPVLDDTWEFTYEAKDGEEVTGTAQHIGETVSAWWGDHNTPEFWWKFASEDDDHQVPAEYTIEDVRKFLASVEDRPLAHVERDLKRI